MRVTNHAEKRMKKRCGANKKSSDRLAELALERGLKHSDTKGSLNKWITKQFFYTKRANNIRIYGEKCYIFHDEVLITVLDVPSNLKKLIAKQ